MFRSLILFCLSCLPVAAHADDLRTSAARLQAAQQAMRRHVSADGLEVDSSPAAVAALQAQWNAARDVVAALLDRDPGVTPVGLVRQAKHSAGLDVEALRLDPDALLVAARSGALATVFIMHRGADGAYRSALALDTPQAVPDSRMPELAAWLPSHAGNRCLASVPQAAAKRCGPLSVDRLIPLPSEAGGARRFAVLADQVAVAGGTIRYQISIWRWDGRLATPLLMRTLFGVLGDTVFGEQDARGFALHGDENYSSLSACGECHGRQTIWRFDLPPTGAAPPHIRSLSPELDLVDRLYTRLFAHRPATDIAAPSVIGRLRNVELDMMNSWRYLGRSGGARLLCLDAMGFDRPQIFRIVHRAGKPFIADVTFARLHACDGPGSHD